jgi:hypothetical protein
MTSQRSKKGRISAAISVELPGIEPGSKISSNCGNTGFDYAKRRETTSRDLRIHRVVLMASTRHQHQGLVSHSLRRVRTSVDALMVTAATASAWT